MPSWVEASAAVPSKDVSDDSMAVTTAPVGVAMVAVMITEPPVTVIVT